MSLLLWKLELSSTSISTHSRAVLSHWGGGVSCRVYIDTVFSPFYLGYCLLLCYLYFLFLAAKIPRSHHFIFSVLRCAVSDDSEIGEAHRH